MHAAPCLTIAGSDPSGGAGIQADLKTFTSLQSYGMSVLTALTAQNTLAVQAVHPIPPEFVVEQLHSVLSDIPPKAIKSGMLSSAPVILALAKALQAHPSPLPPLVIDPVTISTSGHTLLPEDAIDALIHHFIPLGTILTPNILEAEMLLSGGSTAKVDKIDNLQAMFRSARTLARLGCKNVLLKGGHLGLSLNAVRELLEEKEGYVNLGEGEDVRVEVVWPEEMGIKILGAFRSAAAVPTSDNARVLVDVLFEPGTGNEAGSPRFTAVVSPLVETTSTHGTGCTLSAALAVFLARGENVRTATILAIQYVKRALIAAAASPLGAGNGPLDHTHCISYKPLPSPTELNPFPFTTHLIASIKPLWDQYVNHPFVIQLGQGTLDQRKFEHYIKQDYHYLRHYARAHGLLAFKSTSLDDIRAFSEIAIHVARESETHIKFCESFSVSRADLLATPETASSAAYALFILDVGQRGDVLDLLLAVASCCLGYGEVGLMLREKVDNGQDGFIEDGNIYRQWIADYSGKEYQDAVVASIKTLEGRIANDPPSEARLAELTKIWEACTRLEIGFWDGSMNLELDDLETVR